MTADGRLDEGVLRGLIDALVPTLDGLFVLGSSGELTWLPDEMALRVARVAVDQVGGRIPVYVGIGDTGLNRTLARADRLADVGADYLVVAAPFYYPVASEARVVEYFETVAERAAAPVVLYNIPQNTHLTLTPSTVRTLARHPEHRRDQGLGRRLDRLRRASSPCGRTTSASCRVGSTSRRSRSGRAPTA